MATVEIRTLCYSSSIGLNATVANIARRIEARGGYKNVAESVGSEFGIIPGWGHVTFRVYSVPNDPAEMKRAEKAVAAETGLWSFGAETWKHVATEFHQDVIVKSVEETKQVIQDGAKGFGLGIGLGLILLGAAYILVLRGGKA